MENINLVNVLNKYEGKEVSTKDIPWFVLAKSAREWEREQTILKDSIKEAEERINKLKHSYQDAKEKKESLMQAMNQMMESHNSDNE